MPAHFEEIRFDVNYQVVNVRGKISIGDDEKYAGQRDTSGVIKAYPPRGPNDQVERSAT